MFTQRVAGEVISIAGDKLISAYTRADALAFRDRLLGRGVTTATVKRNFEVHTGNLELLSPRTRIGNNQPFMAQTMVMAQHQLPENPSQKISNGTAGMF